MVRGQQNIAKNSNTAFLNLQPLEEERFQVLDIADKPFELLEHLW